LLILRPLKLATPFTVLTVVIPPSAAPVPGLIASVTGPEKPVAVFPLTKPNQKAIDTAALLLASI
jgi:hypothetical protein